MAKVTIKVPDGYKVQVVEKKKEEIKKEQKEPTVKTYKDLTIQMVNRLKNVHHVTIDYRSNS